MKTELLYLEDPYLREMDAEIVGVIPEEGDFFRVILDRTVFYPFGGGQPTDQGRLEPFFEVNKVLLKDGEVNHFVQGGKAPEVGQKVHGVIDWERRLKNMRVHTAAHVIDFAAYLLGYTPELLKPKKGDHGKKAHIVYEGTLEPESIEALQKKSDELIASDVKFSWEFLPLEKLEKEAIYLQPGLPTNKPLRVLRLEGVGAVADGGTILGSTKEVGAVKITAIENKDGDTIVRYCVA